MPSRVRARRWTTSAGALITVMSAAVVVLSFFQPWRSCEDEDTSAGCAMLAQDAAVMGIAAVATLAGVVVAAVGLMWPRSPATSD
jgi:hypothetical protein